MSAAPARPLERAKSFSVELGANDARQRRGASAGPGATATSATGPSPAELDRVRGAVRRAVESVRAPTSALFFHSGPPSHGPALGEMLAAECPLPAVLVPATGVITEEAELEGSPALAGIVWGGASAAAAVADDPAGLLAELPEKGALVVFAAAEGFDSRRLASLSGRHALCFGAGAPASEVIVLREGRSSRGRVAGLRVGQVPIVDAAVSCKLVSGPLVVTEMQGDLVTRLDGRPALDVLRTEAGGGRHGGGLVLVALFEGGHTDRFLVRPLRGIDTDRRALSIAAPLREGDVLGIAVRDGLRAREELGESTLRLERSSRGAAPSFALYLSCAGRGRSLYGAADVDLRILRQRFPTIPIAGMHSAFELVPWGEGGTRLQLMSGVTAVFTQPS